MIIRKNWANNAPWLLSNAGDIETERLQCIDEGKDISSLEEEFAAVQASDLTVEENQQRAEALLDRAQELPLRADFTRREPSDLAGILAERPAQPQLPTRELTDDILLDKALGGWQGRASGCLLGKPVEGRQSDKIETYLRAQGRWPLDRYFSLRGAPDDVKEACGFNDTRVELYEEDITCMVEDDDTNYTVTGLAIVKEFGANFTPENVAHFWLQNLPIFHLCTAERIAYRNLVNLIAPPDSASFRNPYREWIGAQIRADFFGYVNPGNPELAAEFGWRDASISHVKNGIYGEMWAAAMIAAAYLLDDPEAVIRAGLAQIPATSRLTECIEHIIDLWHNGISYEEAIADLRTRWNEKSGHHWVHTISNAEIVAISLLWGNRDFERTICYSVMPGFDTDCNGATAGSVLGIMLGAKNMPAKWIAPLNDTLLTGVAGYHRVSLTAMAEETVRLIHACEAVK